MQNKIFDFKIIPEIVFGNGASEKVGAEARKRGGTKALVVVDPGIIRAGLFDRIEESLTKEGIEVTVFDGVEPEPQIEIADQCAQLGRDKGCDLVVGIGGGSAMDTAKATSILLTNDGKVRDYQGLDLVKKPGVPKIMIPTTAGTGSEVTFTAVFTDKNTKSKAGVNSKYLFADLAFLDPKLTLSLPPEVTAFTGMDALTHAIEAYTSLSSNSFVDLFALEAIRLISDNLHKAVTDGQDIEARGSMLKGSLFGGIALANAGVGAAHALAYPMGGEHQVPHGIANGLLLPYVMEFNLESNIEKFSRIAEAMGERNQGFSALEFAEKSVSAVKKLVEDVKVPTRLRELGIPESAIEGLSSGAMKVTRPIENNPRKVTKEDAIEIYKRAY
ncbi:MAG TPA: alcohol dehydrogenase [Deltaproteobacteria bacterium]|nr:MAG: alcohol dehydrogenase [Deltaproteobacteria bacterium CG_4_10_14_0_8_um_filter_43_12]HCX89868.1 alcohol dehydrogenase [Deltaproteobacteria bacterium]